MNNVCTFETMNYATTSMWSNLLREQLDKDQTIITLTDVPFDGHSPMNQLLLDRCKDIVEFHCRSNHSNDHSKEFQRYMSQLFDRLSTRSGLIQAISVIDNRLVVALVSSNKYNTLRRLNLSRNEIEELNDDFWKMCPKLEELDLSFNKLKEIPYNRETTVSNLKFLNLSHNRIQRIPDDLIEMLLPCLGSSNHASELMELDMSSNEISNLPTLFMEPSNKSLGERSKQCRIVKINFSRNHIRSMPSSITMDSLARMGIQSLDLRYNLIEYEQYTQLQLPLHVKRTLANLGDTFPVEVIPGLYIGGIDSAKNFPLLREKRVHFIINAAQPVIQYPDDFVVVTLDALDSDNQDMTQFFDQTHEFINRAFNEGSGVLIHCIAGISRSACLAMSYIMKYKNMSFSDTFDLLRSKRNQVEPNMSFQVQLIDYEKELTSR